MRAISLLTASFLIVSMGGIIYFSENPQAYGSIPDTGQKVAEFQKQERRIFEELENLDKKLRKLYSQIENLSDQRQNVEKEQIRVREELRQLQQEMEKNRKKVKTRLVALYKFKQMGYVAPLFTVENFHAAVEAGYIATRLILSDHRFFLHLRQNYSKVRWMEHLLAEKEKELGKLQAQLDLQQRELLTTKEKEIELLVKMRGQKKLYAQDAKISEEDDSIPEPLERIPEQTFTFEQSSASPASSENVSIQRGGLPFPTTGQITKTYGAKKNSPYRTILYNNGIIIEAPKGQTVQAVHEGVVVFADWFKNYGKVMIIDHGDRYHSLIAHADRLLKRAGEKVKTGEVIATVGDTASQDGPKLYFELRHHGQPVDPMQWLAANKLTKK